MLPTQDVRLWKRFASKLRDEVDDLLVRQCFLVERFYVANEVSQKSNVRRHGRFERGIRGEHDYRVNYVLIDAKRVFYRLDMLIVLTEWILELPLLPVEVLRPATVGLAAKYPPPDVLRFYDKYAKTRDKYMVDLRRPIRGSEHHVVHAVIYGFIQASPSDEAYIYLATQALDPLAPQYPTSDNYNGDDIPHVGWDMFDDLQRRPRVS